MSGTSYSKGRPDQGGPETGLFRKNRALIIKTATHCAICGGPLDKSLKFPDPMSATADHIIPVSRGGRSTIDNLQAAHLCCNRQKSNSIGNKNTKAKAEDIGNRTLPQYVDWIHYDGA